MYAHTVTFCGGTNLGRERNAIIFVHLLALKPSDRGITRLLIIRVLIKGGTAPVHLTVPRVTS